MGLAIQRGATCMVAAVDELVSEGRARRAYALAEAALWVGGLSSIALMLHWLNMSLGIYRVTGWTVAGGVMLGIGAWINRACVFGAVARIGSATGAWIATPVGFFIGCLFPVVAPEPYAVGTAAGSPTIATVTILAFLIFAVWRLVEALHSQQITVHLWHPHRATLLIAVTFVVTLLTVGAWAYTDALAAIARNDEALLSLRAAMVAALLGGAILGGALAGNEDSACVSRHGPALHCRRDDDGNWRETGAGQQRRTYPAWLTRLAATCLGSRRIDGAVDRRCNRNFTLSTAIGCASERRRKSLGADGFR